MTRMTIHDLVRGLANGQLDRREFLTRAAALGVSATAANLFLRAVPTSAAEVLPPVVATP